MASAVKRQTAKDTTRVALAYFERVTNRDADGMAAAWRPGSVGRFVGDAELVAPEGIRSYFSNVFAAFPDFAMEVVSTTSDSRCCAVRWQATGTFAGSATFQGLEPNGARVTIEGLDLVTVEDGLVVSNLAYVNMADVARQLGVLPPIGSKQEQRMVSLVNRIRKLSRRFGSKPLERIADGVWLLRGGAPVKVMNVYFLEDGGQVTVFDAGISSMVEPIGLAAGKLGGIRRLVLGHGHPDHRGAAAGLKVPTYCHPLEVPIAEGDGGMSMFDFDKLKPPAKPFFEKMLPIWDGGPVKIDGTVEEGDEIAGFRVVHIPGHSPGQIALFRESDRLALTTDLFYAMNPETGLPGPPRLPIPAFMPDRETALASLRKVAALEPSVAWPGHLGPVRGDVRAALEEAAAES